MLLRSLLLGAALLSAPTAVFAQSLYSISGGIPGTSIVNEFTGPPGGACAYPNGPGLVAFATAVPFACPTVGPTPPAPSLLGDVAHDHKGDVVWATNGPLVTAYTPAGAVITSFPTPAPLGPLTGLGFNTAAGILWMTDGALVMGVAAPGPCVRAAGHHGPALRGADARPAHRHRLGPVHRFALRLLTRPAS